MPRTARKKNISGIYHIIVRSISDIPLFKNNYDKEKYLCIIEKYQKIYLFRIYAYCLMTTHAHMIIDCCGSDISKVMKSINQSYAAYFNKKYKRHGHLFQDRFKSKLVENENYLLNLSAYIHNNPKSIKKYNDEPEKYSFSSLGIYLSIATDKHNILNTDYILNHFSGNKTRSKQLYLEFVNKSLQASDEAYLEFRNASCESNEKNISRMLLIRDFCPRDILQFISSYTSTSFNIHIKFIHTHTELRAVCVLVMRSLCNYTLTDISRIIGNVTVSNLCRLCNKGYKLITENPKYTNLIEDLITKFSVA